MLLANIEYGIELSTGYSDDYPYAKPRNLLHIRFLHHSWWFTVPQLIKPKCVWVDTSGYDWAKKDGSKGYWNHIRRDYGIGTFDNSLHIRYGIQPGSWSKSDPKNSDHTFVWFIPWLNQRFVRKSYYDAFTQEHMRTFWEKDQRGKGIRMYEEQREFEDKEYKHMLVKFKDFDNEEVTAKCRIEEMEWRWGTGFFKWLSLFRKPFIRRTLWISFDKETGYEKGSWKGGTMGQGIDMLPGEIAEDAFTRYARGTDRYKNYGVKPRNMTALEFDYE